MCTISDKVPVEHYEAFHNLIKQSGARYIGNPQRNGEYYYVSFSFDLVTDYVYFTDHWRAFQESTKTASEKISLSFKIISFVRGLLK